MIRMEGSQNMNSTLELITGIVSRLPESAEESRILRQKTLAAESAADGAEPGIVTEINATIMAMIAAQSATDIPDDDSGTDAAAPDAGQVGGGDVDDDASAVATAQFTPPDETDGGQAAQPVESAQSAPAAEPVAQKVDEPVAEPAAAAREAEPAKWTEREKLLYSDIIHLFQLGDHSGAMASLERVYMLAPAATELGIFLKKNESTLLKLYRDHIGSMDRVTLPSRGRRTVRIPTPDPDLMLKIIRMSDGHRPIKEFIRKMDEPELHILMVISHLTRSGYLELA